MLTRIRKFFARPTTKTTSATKPARRQTPRLENLETRAMPATNLTASVTGGVLRIEGTAGNDRILVREQAGQIRIENATMQVNGNAVSSVPAASLRGIVVDAKGGNDVVSLSAGNRAVTVDAVLMGGAGNDVLSGGRGRDILVGGSGADVFVKHGNDRVRDLTREDRVVRTTSRDAEVVDAALMGMEGQTRSNATRAVQAYKVRNIVLMNTANSNNYSRVANMEVGFNTSTRAFAITVPNTNFGVLSGTYRVVGGVRVFETYRVFRSGTGFLHVSMTAKVGQGQDGAMYLYVNYASRASGSATMVTGTSGYASSNSFETMARLTRTV